MQMNITVQIIFLEDVVERQPDVDKEEVIEFLEDKWDQLEEFEHKPDNYSGEKYSLVFYKSSKYYFIIGISLEKDRVNILSAYPCGQYRGKPGQLAKRFG